MGDTTNGKNAQPDSSVNGQATPASAASSMDFETASLPQRPLGSHGDVPVAYAILHVDIDESSGTATSTRYLYANLEYCRVSQRSAQGIIGASHVESDQDEWLAQCYLAVAKGQTINGFKYSSPARSWISFNLAPSDVAGCCIYAFITVDEKHLDEEMISVDARTSHIVSNMLSALTGERSHEAAMNGMLEMMSTIIHADRLTVFECGGLQTKITFELCSRETQSLLGTVFDLPRSALQRWFSLSIKDPVALVPDAAIIERFSPALYAWCVENDVKSLMAAPFFNDGEIVGFLGAYNYVIDETIDLNKLFEAVSSFIGARLDNHRLIDDLDWAGKHDPLTNLFNRRGAELAMNARFAAQPNDPHALVLVDLDDFKRINDVYGHAAGDEALRATAQAMTHAFPDDAILCRSGGDEFLALLSGSEADDVARFVEGLELAGFGFDLDGKHQEFTASIGYARYPDHANGIEELEAKADAAVYAVKLAGKAGHREYAHEEETPDRSQLGFAARDIVENVPYPMVVHRVGDDNAILFASSELASLLDCDSMYDLIRYSDGSLTGIIHPDDWAHTLASLAEQIRAGGNESEFSFDLRVITKAGTIKNVRAVSRLVDIGDAGTVYYTLVNLKAWN